MILCKFKECGDWKEAFDFGAPKRWKRDEVTKSRRRKKNKNKENS
jgi:hypothetical protein